jgi:hypothetical protein
LYGEAPRETIEACVELGRVCVLGGGEYVFEALDIAAAWDTWLNAGKGAVVAGDVVLPTPIVPAFGGGGGAALLAGGAPYVEPPIGGGGMEPGGLVCWDAATGAIITDGVPCRRGTTLAPKSGVSFQVSTGAILDTGGGPTGD